RGRVDADEQVGCARTGDIDIRSAAGHVEDRAGLRDAVLAANAAEAQRRGNLAAGDDVHGIVEAEQDFAGDARAGQEGQRVEGRETEIDGDAAGADDGAGVDQRR